MPTASANIAPGTRVILADGPDFRAMTVIHTNGRVLMAARPNRGGESGGPVSGFLPVPDSYENPPAWHLSEVRQVELMYDDRIPTGVLEAAELRDASAAVIGAKFQAAADHLFWVGQHLYPLDPDRFGEHLACAQRAYRVASAEWLRVAPVPADVVQAQAAE